MENVFCKLSLTKKFTHQIHNSNFCGNVEKSATLPTSSTDNITRASVGARDFRVKKRGAFFATHQSVCNLLITNGFLNADYPRHCVFSSLETPQHSDAVHKQSLCRKQAAALLYHCTYICSDKKVSSSRATSRQTACQKPRFSLRY